MNIRVLVVFWLAFVSLSNRATGTLRCAHADLSKLAKAVYVSPQGHDGVGCGQSPTAPCQTIQQGITNCSGESCGVLVRYGMYSPDKPIHLAEGVNIYGSCLFDEETPYRYRSTVIGNPAIQANEINKETVLEGFVILGRTAVKTGEASVAFLVSHSTGLVLRENVIASGPGGKGANGNTPFAGGGGSGWFAPNPTTGGAGSFACSANPPPGSTGRGGKGGDERQISSSCPIYLLGQCKCSDRRDGPVPVGQNGASSGSVPGGAGGQPGSPGCSCTNRASGDAGSGADGRSGVMGSPGTQGGSQNPDTKGSFAGTTWQPNVGGTGAAGQVGSGGGGGGAGGFSALTASNTNRNGYPGGGGGGGGCGGPGGTGAQQGGASVPLVLFASSVAGLATSNALIPGPGGQGGQGGTGARGGPGGSGGRGFQGLQYSVEQGLGGIVCKGKVPGFGGSGGPGGQGGAGGGGAGGNGGPSFGIALVNSSPLSANDFIFYKGQPGPGGNLGPGGQNDATNKGGNGEPGLEGFSHDSMVSFTSTNLSIGTNP